MRYNEIINETTNNKVHYDSNNGIGSGVIAAVSHYSSNTVWMKPSVFLELSEPMHNDSQDKETVEWIMSQLQKGMAMAVPLIVIEFPYDRMTRKQILEPALARVDRHDGRHRAKAIWQLYGDIPMLVNILLDPETTNPHTMKELCGGVRSQQSGGPFVPGPLWT